MKYLKKFNELKTDDIVSDLEDICLELKDKGFHIEIDTQYENCYLNIYKKSHPAAIGLHEFSIEDINDTLLRIKDYLGDKWVDTNCNEGSNGKIVIAEVEFKLDNNINESSSHNEKIEDLKDICIDIVDQGYSISFSNHVDKISASLSIQMRSSNGLEDYKWKVIKETLLRIEDYLGNDLLGITSISSGDSNYKPLNIKSEFDYSVYTILVRFKSNVKNLYMYESFNKSIKDDVDDILLELIDNGFEYKNEEINHYGTENKTYLIYRISIFRQNKFDNPYPNVIYNYQLKEYNYSEVEEVVNRLIRYLGERIISKQMMNKSWVAFPPKKNGDITGIGQIEIIYYI